MFSNFYQDDLQYQSSIYCARCNEPFHDQEYIAKTGAQEHWHLKCFVCAQCFKPLKDYEYYEQYGRKYCRRDFEILFAPFCSGCNHSIVNGRFIRTLNRCWHRDCLRCQQCNINLPDRGIVMAGLNNQVLCDICKVDQELRACNKCKSHVEPQELIKYREEIYHCYHFNCNSCGCELDKNAREIQAELYCLRCHDKMGMPICGACRRPIEERVVTALGKHWHVDHFVCSVCERPFLGKRHFEVKGLAYCEQHHRELFGNECQTCGKMITGDVVSTMDKYYCVDHFCCYYCGGKLVANKSTFFDIGSNPCCKKCYKRFPASVRKRLARQQKLDRKAAAAAAAGTT